MLTKQVLSFLIISFAIPLWASDSYDSYDFSEDSCELTLPPPSDDELEFYSCEEPESDCIVLESFEYIKDCPDFDAKEARRKKIIRDKKYKNNMLYKNLIYNFQVDKNNKKIKRLCFVFAHARHARVRLGRYKISKQLKFGLKTRKQHKLMQAWERAENYKYKYMLLEIPNEKIISKCDVNNCSERATIIYDKRNQFGTKKAKKYIKILNKAHCEKAREDIIPKLDTCEKKIFVLQRCYLNQKMYQ